MNKYKGTQVKNKSVFVSYISDIWIYFFESDVLAVQQWKHNKKKKTKYEKGIGNTLDWGWPTILSKALAWGQR